MRFGTELSQFLRVFLPTLPYCTVKLILPFYYVYNDFVMQTSVYAFNFLSGRAFAWTKSKLSKN